MGLNFINPKEEDILLIGALETLDATNDTLDPIIFDVKGGSYIGLVGSAIHNADPSEDETDDLTVTVTLSHADAADASEDDWTELVEIDYTVEDSSNLAILEYLKTSSISRYLKVVVEVNDTMTGTLDFSLNAIKTRLEERGF